MPIRAKFEEQKTHKDNFYFQKNNSSRLMGNFWGTDLSSDICHLVGGTTNVDYDIDNSMLSACKTNYLPVLRHFEEEFQSN